MFTIGQKILLLIGAFYGFSSVAMGAFGAHSLKERLSLEMLAVFEVGARYQMYHALAILITVWLSTAILGSMPIWAGWCFVVGTLIFSGSLYALAITNIKILGAITPIGGLLLLAGWLVLMIAICKVASI